MKLQKRFLRKYKEKDYHKFMVNLPPKVVAEAGMKEGDNLNISAQNGTIVIEKKKLSS